MRERGREKGREGEDIYFRKEEREELVALMNQTFPFLFAFVSLTRTLSLSLFLSLILSLLSSEKVERAWRNDIRQVAQYLDSVHPYEREREETERGREGGRERGRERVSVRGSLSRVCVRISHDFSPFALFLSPATPTLCTI